MGTRILMVHDHLVRSQRLNSRCLSYLLRFFSNQKRDSNTTANNCQNPSNTVENTDSGLDSKWLDIKAGIFGPRDFRFRLPGDIGLDQDFNIKHKSPEIRKTLIAEKFDWLLSVPGDGILEPVSEKDYNINVGLSNLELQSVRKLMTSFENYDTHYDVELNGYPCPNLLKRDFQFLFPHYDIETNGLSVLIMCQKTKYDMSGWSEDVEKEREFLVNRFVECASIICKTLEGMGFWSDYIDPFSGSSALGPNASSTFFETDERFRHFGLRIEDLGCCKVVSHPVWKKNVFVGSIFTDAVPSIAKLLSKVVLLKKP